MNGAELGWPWALPFAGLLLSIALGPLALPAHWHRLASWVVAAWIAAFLVPFAALRGTAPASEAALHVLVGEYLPFVVLIGTLYTIAGGLGLRGNLHGSPGLNVALMAIGALLASVMGTTGAAMLMVRPLIRANDDRPRAGHVFVFFIFVVANAAGALTPLGDPPLFLGYLNGVPFDWPVRHLWAPTALLIGALLALFAAIDAWFERRDGRRRVDPTPDAGPLRLEGAVNVLLLAATVGCVLALRGLGRDGALVALALLSLALTPRGVRVANGYSWAPLREVVLLFLGIFLTMLPVLAMLRAGEQGAFAALIRETAGASGEPLPIAYFWLAGALSAVLDNAPTYLVFFNLAGGDAARLTGPLAQTLAAISAGAVYMGAYTYIGNAPNMMVKAVAEHHGIRMPGFFAYLLWSGIILSPLFLVISLVWFR